jgi:hypothetical protein
MNRQEIEKFLDKICVTDYTISDDLTVDVNGRVTLGNRTLAELPFQFGKVTGDFSCGYNQLTSLKNSPYYVGGLFSCVHNKLTSLQYCPQHVGCFFSCSTNYITSLQYCPKYIGGNFYCMENKLSSVKKLLEIHIGGAIFVNDYMEQTSEYKLLMKLREL